MTAGFSKEVEWDGGDDNGDEVAPGVYFVKLEHQGEAIVEKMVVIM